eukprot:g13674.t1
MAKGGAVAGPVYYLTMFFLLQMIVLGALFVYFSMSEGFFAWKVEDCLAEGRAPEIGNDVYQFDLDLEVDIGWREFTVTFLDPGAEIAGCFPDLEQDETYSLGDFQDNSASLAGLGMVASWGVGVLVALYTILAMLQASSGYRRGGVSMVALSRWCALFAIGVVTATTVFWWLVEGKFGRRTQALAPRLFELTKEAADRCNIGTDKCREAFWDMETPGMALKMGITAMFTYGAAAVLLWLISPRVDHLNSGVEEPEVIEPAKQAVGGNVVEKTPQPEEKARAKDRRSAKTGVRAGGGGGRAPTSTVEGAPVAGPDPMTYALQQGNDEELGSIEDEEEDEVVYQNHQVHHAVINHSNPNPTQQVDDQASRQISRGYSRGTSGASYVTGGGRSFDEGQSEFSDAASSQYYAQGQGTGGRSFMSSSSRGESFDEYR